MKVIEYKGFKIAQAYNNHITIFRDNILVFHTTCHKKMNEDELKQQVEWYLKLKEELK